jgi:sugar phosphate isomerase/epimerase
MKFAICNELFENWPFDRVCKFAVELGYAGVELAPFTLAPTITDLSAVDRVRLRQTAETVGVEIVGLHWLLAKTQGLHLTTPDTEQRQRTSDYLVELARACRDLGGSLMVFGSPQQRSLLPGMSWEQAFEFAADTFRRAMPVIGELGICVCLEPLAPTETNFINTCEQGRQLIERVGHPAFTLHLDVKAMSSEPVGMPELIQQYAPAAGHFHANDANRRGPGFGEVDFVPIFRALRRAGYDRWVSVEVFDFAPNPETIARHSIEYMRQCLALAG